jgi:hypothetical protein
LVYDYLKPLTPEEREAQTRQEIEERKALVQTEKERLRRQREQRENEKTLIAKTEKETNEQKRQADWANITYGLSKEQIKILERLIQIEPSIGNNEELHAEYNVLMRELTKTGKDMGEIVLTPHTYYTSESGILIIPNAQGNFTLREGTLGKFETTDKTLVNDDNTKLPSKITQPAVIPKSNIQLPNIWTIKIQEQPTKEPEKKTGISNRLKSQSKEELEKVKRQLTNKEEKQRKKLF